MSRWDHRVGGSGVAPAPALPAFSPERVDPPSSCALPHPASPLGVFTSETGSSETRLPREAGEAGGQPGWC